MVLSMTYLRGIMYAPQHAADNRRPVSLALIFSALVLLLGVVGGWSFAASASASTLSRADAALNWAESQTGKPYVWAGAGPYGYDCSGLVMAAYAHAGIQLPHNTVAMLYSGKLVRTYHPKRGDLAFYGTGHVEFVTIWYHTTFGAHNTGSRIGWIRYGYGWQPTAFYHVIG